MVGAPTLAGMSRRVFWRRRALALGALALPLGVALGVTSGSGGEAGAGRDRGAVTGATADGPPPAELPRGGRRLFPAWRVVAAYGAPQDDELGMLGIGSPDQATRRLLRLARHYRKRSRPQLPALELIAVIANAHPGADGRYRTRQTDAVIRRYLRAARRHKALLVLDVQPGRSDFLAEARRLDPEWRMHGSDAPGKAIGHVSAREVNAVSEWLRRIVERHRLPEKLLIVHQFTDDMIRPKSEVKTREGLAIVFNIDGFGGHEIKKAKYRHFTGATPRGHHDGFKLFFREDTNPIMRPSQVLAMNPPPDVVVYE
jgi:hypothetical protein